ncbi:MAG: hypothetical protein Q4F72_09200, partial [Desulfovibrionaceae bacterium]|nr:hypothetical protein [Desulfovibrionaceae bacterium]
MAQTGRRRAGTRGRKKAEAATRPAAAGAAEKPVRGLAPGVENFFTGLPPEELGGPLTKEETGMALMAAGGRANAASGVMSLVISSLQVVRRLAAGARRGETGTPAVLYSLIESGSPAPCLETGRLLLEQPERADLVTAAVLAEHLTRFAGHGSWDSLELALRLAARLPVLAEAEEVRARLLGLLDIAVKKGLPQALREDGLILKEGLLTDRDTARARDLLEKTWAAGDAEAGLGLAGLLLEEAPSPEERRRALAILRGLADADSPGACALLGAELALGGREPGSADSADEGDFAEGVALLEKACALGRAREVTAVCQRLFALAMVRADRSCAKSGAKAAGTSSAKSASARSASAKGSARSVSKEPAGAAPRGKAGPGEQEAAERLLDRALAADCPEAEILRTRL